MNYPRNIFSSFSKKPPAQEHKKDIYNNPWMMVRHWYRSDLGQALLEHEQQCLKKLLEHIFGYNLVQLGCLDENPLTSGTRTSFQFIFESLAQSIQANSCTHVNSRFDELPLQSHSIDVIVLPHTLEFEANPHQILREVERVLVAEGKAIFLGFNPISLWGFWHKYWELKHRISRKGGTWKVPLPSCGHLLSQKRLRDWLQLMGFDIDLVNEYFYRPPLQSAALLKKMKFIERAGQLSRIMPAGAYLMVATKRVSTLTPIIKQWKFSNTIIGSETAEPAGFKRSGIKKRFKQAVVKEI